MLLLTDHNPYNVLTHRLLYQAYTYKTVHNTSGIHQFSKMLPVNISTFGSGWIKYTVARRFFTATLLSKVGVHSHILLQLPSDSDCLKPADLGIAQLFDFYVYGTCQCIWYYLLYWSRNDWYLFHQRRFSQQQLFFSSACHLPLVLSLHSFPLPPDTAISHCFDSPLHNQIPLWLDVTQHHEDWRVLYWRSVFIDARNLLRIIHTAKRRYQRCALTLWFLVACDH